MSPNGGFTSPTVYASSSQKLCCPIAVKRTAAATAVRATSPASSTRSGRPAGSPRSGCGTPGGDVQAHVVDLHRVAQPLRDRVHVRLPQLVGQLLKMVPEADRADVVARLPRGHRP